ncbi:hypothetical protein, partial [Pseudomonas sp. 2995-1]|uniref:hypothetical protein n=1 Tax=Pseudomonas sp. 2995-1 TaxID=1712679 RepID=UPI001C445EFF
TFTALRSPSIDVDANFGAAFSVSTSNYSTDYRYTSGNRGIDFTGSYRIRATLGIPINIGGFEFPIGRELDWGYVNVTHR